MFEANAMLFFFVILVEEGIDVYLKMVGMELSFNPIYSNCSDSVDRQN